MEAEREKVVIPYRKYSQEAKRKWRESAASPSPCHNFRPNFRELELTGAVMQLTLILRDVSGPVYVPLP